MAGFTLNIPTVDGDIKKVEEYLYRLDKQLRYMFSNIDPEDNYSAAALLKSADANNRIEVNEKAILLEAQRASDAEDALSSRIDVNAQQILLKVSTDSLVSSMNSQLQITGNSINLTTGHFTIDSTNFKVNASGDVTIKGNVEAYGFVSTRGGVDIYTGSGGTNFLSIYGGDPGSVVFPIGEWTKNYLHSDHMICAGATWETDNVEEWKPTGIRTHDVHILDYGSVKSKLQNLEQRIANLGG